MTIQYFPMTTSDVDLLMTIEEACHSHPWSHKTFTSCIGGRYFGYLAKIADEIIGFYVGEHVAGEATLMDICVAPTQQGKKYGQELLSHFIAQAQQLGNNKIWLEVRAKNFAAQMLYIKNGFSEVSRRTGYYPSASGMGYEDAIVMCLTQKKQRNKKPHNKK